MKSGYLYLQTHAEHADRVRFLTAEAIPSEISQPPVSIRYIARFSDIEAGLMHVQNALCRKLIDIDEHLYRVDVYQAIAVVAADALKHETVWLDTSLTDAERERISQLEQILRNRQRRYDNIWQWVGTGALIFLFSGLLVLF